MSRSKSLEAERLIGKCRGGQFFPSSVWWNGPGDTKNASGSEPDQYGVQAREDARAYGAGILCLVTVMYRYGVQVR